VKRLLNSHTIEDKMFQGEVKSMMMVNHKNVVRFLGYCSHTEEHALKMQGNLIIAQVRERLLCFEYLINGSLEIYLTGMIRHILLE
jgi:coatomer subunit beta'